MSESRNSPTDEFQLDREVIGKATPGPWLGFMDTVQQSTQFENPVRICQIPGDTYDVIDPDRRFIARARTRWQFALDEIDRLRAKLEAAEKVVEAVDRFSKSLVGNRGAILSGSSFGLMVKVNEALADHYAAAKKEWGMNDMLLERVEHWKKSCLKAEYENARLSFELEKKIAIIEAYKRKCELADDTFLELKKLAESIQGTVRDLLK